MAITDSQLTQVYLVDTTTTLTAVSDIETAIASATKLTCFQSFGDLVETRAAQEYKCIDSNGSQKSMGSVSLGNVAVEFLFDATDTTGQSVLRTMFEGNTRKRMIVQLNDEPTTGASPHPTYIDVEVANASSGITIALDAAVVYKTSIELCSRMVWNNAAETTV